MQQACSKAMSIIVGGMTRWCRWFTGTLVFGKLGYDTDEKYYNHEPQSVYESTDNKLLWDFKIQTDNKIEHNKPDILVLDKIEWKCLIIGVPCLFNTLVKEKEKIENYQDLKWELKMDLEIAQSNCGANHNWCIKNCLERQREVVSIRVWCHRSFRIIA